MSQDRKDKMPLDKNINKDRSDSAFDKSRGTGAGQGGLQQDKLRDKSSQTGQGTKTGAGSATTTNTTSTTGTGRK